MSSVTDIENDRSYEELLLELPEAERQHTDIYCPQCGSPPGDVCRQPDHRCPYRCEPA